MDAIGSQDKKDCVALHLLFIYLFQQTGSEPCNFLEPQGVLKKTKTHQTIWTPVNAEE